MGHGINELREPLRNTTGVMEKSTNALISEGCPKLKKAPPSHFAKVAP